MSSTVREQGVGVKRDTPCRRGGRASLQLLSVPGDSARNAGPAAWPSPGDTISDPAPDLLNRFNSQATPQARQSLRDSASPETSAPALSGRPPPAFHQPGVLCPAPLYPPLPVFPRPQKPGISNTPIMALSCGCCPQPCKRCKSGWRPRVHLSTTALAGSKPSVRHSWPLRIWCNGCSNIFKLLFPRGGWGTELRAARLSGRNRHPVHQFHASRFLSRLGLLRSPCQPTGQPCVHEEDMLRPPPRCNSRPGARKPQQANASCFPGACYTG